MSIRYDDFTIRQMVADYRSGLGFKEMVKLYRGGWLKIRGILAACGVTIRKKGRVVGSTWSNKLSLSNRARLLKLANSKRLTLEAIGKKFGVTREYVRLLFKNNGLRLQHSEVWKTVGPVNALKRKALRLERRKARADKFKRLVKAWNSGMSATEICNRFFRYNGPRKRPDLYAITRIGYHRARHPELFPYRRRVGSIPRGGIRKT